MENKKRTESPRYYMKKSRQAKSFIQQPSYPGGRAAINELIRRELRYPEKALEAKVEGKVKVSYTLNHKGLVTAAKVAKGLGYGCDEEAIRLVNLLRFDVPKNRGVKVIFNKTITINFRLPKQKTPNVNYQYTFSNTKKIKSGKSYTITVNY